MYLELKYILDTSILVTSNSKRREYYIPNERMDDDDRTKAGANVPTDRSANLQCSSTRGRHRRLSRRRWHARHGLSRQLVCRMQFASGSKQGRRQWNMARPCSRIFHLLRRRPRTRRADQTCSTLRHARHLYSIRGTGTFSWKSQGR